MGKPQIAADSAELEALLAAYTPAAGKKRYQHAHWLKSSFDSEVWIIVCDVTFYVDWRVTLPDGTLLTQHATLWETFRSWLIARTHIDTTGGRTGSLYWESQHLRRVLFCIDHILINADHFQIAEHALSAVSLNDLCSILIKISARRTTIDSLYEWPHRLTKYIRERLDALPHDATHQAEPPRESWRLVGLS